MTCGAKANFRVMLCTSLVVLFQRLQSVLWLQHLSDIQGKRGNEGWFLNQEKQQKEQRKHEEQQQLA